MECPQEYNNIPRQGARRRSSLFVVQGNNLPSFQTCDSQYTYPAEYQEKLELELEQWKREDEKFNPIILEKTSRLTSQPLRDEDILSVEQLDFLSSLPDYDKYLECVYNFSSKFESALEKIAANNEQLLTHKKHVEDLSKEVFNLCKADF